MERNAWLGSFARINVALTSLHGNIRLGAFRRSRQIYSALGNYAIGLGHPNQLDGVQR